jgi:hypothetical protein
MYSILLALLVGSSANFVLGTNPTVDKLEQDKKDALNDAKTNLADAKDAVWDNLKKARENTKLAIEAAAEARKAKKSAEEIEALDATVKIMKIEEDAKFWAYHNYLAKVATVFTGVVLGQYAIDYFKVEGKYKTEFVKYGSATAFALATGYAVYKAYEYFTEEEDENEIEEEEYGL